MNGAVLSLRCFTSFSEAYISCEWNNFPSQPKAWRMRRTDLCKNLVSK